MNPATGTGPFEPGNSRTRTRRERLRDDAHRYLTAPFTLLAVTCSVLFAVRMLAGGLIGMSDQGDGHRLLCRLGLRQDVPYNSSTRDHFQPRWLDHTWYGEDCGAAGEPYHSTQLALAWIATRVTHAVTDLDGLDLRVMALLSSVVVGVLIAAVTVLAARRWFSRVLVAGALFLITADGSFAGYFASAYSEPGSFTGLLLLTAAVLSFLRTPRVRGRHLLVLTAATALLIGAKTQNATVLAAVVPLLLLRPWRGSRRGVPSAGSPSDEMPSDEMPSDEMLSDGGMRGGAHLARRVPALVLAALLATGSVAYLQAQPDRFTTQNDYAAVFIEMLPHSPDPAGDVAELGLPPSMVESSGISIGAPGSAANSIAFADFSERASLSHRVGLYLRHPTRLPPMLVRGVEAMGSLRSDYTYSYPASAGEGPGASECRVCVVHDVWTGLFAGRPGLLIAVYLLCGVTCATLAWLRRAQPATRALAGTGLVLLVALTAQFWVVMLTEGASDIVKHMVGANFTFALVVLFTAASAGACAVRNPDDPYAGPRPVEGGRGR